MFWHALPFALSFALVPLYAMSAINGGPGILLGPMAGYAVISVLDRLRGLNERNLDPDTPSAALFWHKLITWGWLPMQLALIYGGLAAIFLSDHLTTVEGVCLMIAVGIVTGSIGINYAHELIHQRNRWERRLGRALLVTVLYGHFETEHLRVHHQHVATPRDAVTARYNEGFWRFFPRVLWQTLASAWAADRAMLARRNWAVWHRSNPFWSYGLGALFCLGAAFAIGGWPAVGLFALQALVAVLHLELVNYVEHYGLVRLHLGNGRFEPVRPHHSWNASQAVSNWLLINLQRHSDHHTKPDRRFPLLQTYSQEEAPQLPFGYPLMCLMAAIPPIWRRVMNRRVRDWRRQHYPQVTDWAPAKRGAPVSA
ncbi:MAG: alkane 1-monooxygenase [Pseudomonadota bacterium]